MTRIITYSLRQDAKDSDKYYQDIATFTDKWLAGVVLECRGLLERIRAFRRTCGEVDRTDAEYLFELLVLSVLMWDAIILGMITASQPTQISTNC